MHLLRLARATQHAKRAGSGRFHTNASRGAMLASTPAAAAPGPTSGSTAECSSRTKPPAQPSLSRVCSRVYIGTLINSSLMATALQAIGTFVALAAVAEPQHNGQYRPAVPPHHATCSTTIGRPRCVTEVACCANALPRGFYHLMHGNRLLHFIFPLSRTQDASEMMRYEHCR